MENQYFERIEQVWNRLTPWQQTKLYIKAMVWARYDRICKTLTKLEQMLKLTYKHLPEKNAVSQVTASKEKA